MLKYVNPKVDNKYYYTYFQKQKLKPLPDFNEISPPIKIEQIGKLAGEKRNIDEAAVLSVGAAIYD